MANVLLLFKFSVRCHVCFFWSASLLLDAWMSSTLSQATWQLWLHPLVFATKLADTICFSIWPFHWWNSILSEGNVIKMNRTLKIWELFDMGQTTYEVSAFQWLLIHICMQCFKYYQLFGNIDQLQCQNTNALRFLIRCWKIKTSQMIRWEVNFRNICHVLNIF